MSDKVTSNMSVWNDSIDIEDYVIKSLGPKRVALNWLLPLTVVYSIIFLTGIVGNVCTCVVIGRNQYMQTATNCYLFNLAIADMMTLLFVEKDGNFWFRQVSRKPATSRDVLRLEEQLDRELVREEAREMGICPVRRRIYDQLLEELVRQEVLACPERGRLLKMAQLECRLSLVAAVRCYESAIAYGLKRCLASRGEVARLTSEVTELQSKLDSIQEEIKQLEPKVAQVRQEMEALESRKQEELAAVEYKVQAENEHMLRQLMQCIDVIIETDS